MSRQVKFLYSKYNKVLNFENIDREDAKRISASLGNCRQGTEDFLDKYFNENFLLTGQELLEEIFRIQNNRGEVYDLKSNKGFENKVFYINENKVNCGNIKLNIILYKGLLLYRAK